MALAATGTEVASAAISENASGPLLVEAEMVSSSASENKTPVSASAEIALPSITLDGVSLKSDETARVSNQNICFPGYQDTKATQPKCFHVPAPQKVVNSYDADGRRLVSIADANERQLLFVKITRG